MIYHSDVLLWLVIMLVVSVVITTAGVGLSLWCDMQRYRYKPVNPIVCAVGYRMLLCSWWSAWISAILLLCICVVVGLRMIAWLFG